MCTSLLPLRICLLTAQQQRETLPLAGTVEFIIRDGYTIAFGRQLPARRVLQDALRQAASNDPRLPEQYGIPLTRTNFAWQTTRGDRRIVVGVMDSGCGEQTRQC